MGIMDINGSIGPTEESVKIPKQFKAGESPNQHRFRTMHHIAFYLNGESQ